MNTETWKRFRIADLFEMERGRTPGKIKQLPGTTPYIGASKLNNGAVAHVDATNAQTWTNKITIANGGDGAAGIAFYQQQEFCASSTVHVLTLLNHDLTSHIGLFISTILSLLHQKYNFGRGLSLQRLAVETIRLPYSGTEPDWNWIEAYMNNQISKVKDELPPWT